MPGLFKLEFEGTRGIALCSKCYCMENEEKSKARLSSKGVSKRQNKLTWERYEAALKDLKGEEDKAIKRGFRMVRGTMRIHTQNKLGMSAYYIECCWTGSTGSLLSITYKRKSSVGQNGKELLTFGPCCK